MPNMHPSRVNSGCSGPTVVTLVKQEYCREHFIQTCYEHLEECAEKFKERDQADELACVTRRRSLQDIVDQSTSTSLTHGDLSNLERIQLLDIVRWAGDLLRQIRRGPRKRVSIPVRLYLESSSQTRCGGNVGAGNQPTRNCAHMQLADQHWRAGENRANGYRRAS
jgi:hypothetical protein